jgi:prepilin-type processing-associated H-X9-DG protein
MKLSGHMRTTSALTLLEVLLILAFLIFVAYVFVASVPVRRRPVKGPTIALCLNNLQMIYDASEAFSLEHDAQFPPRVSITNGGALEASDSPGSVLTFEVLSNYLKPDSLRSYALCLDDRVKTKASPGVPVTRGNVSYFFNLDVTPTSPTEVMAGDRYLELDHKPVNAGIISVQETQWVSWTREMHLRTNRACGNLLFNDGHAETVGSNLTEIMRAQNSIGKRLAVP